MFLVVFLKMVEVTYFSAFDGMKEKQNKREGGNKRLNLFGNVPVETVIIMLMLVIRVVAAVIVVNRLVDC